MAFPNLVPKTDLRKGPGGESTIWAENVGVPVNGNNTIGLPFINNGIESTLIDEDWMRIEVEGQGPSVTGFRWVSLSADKQSMVLDFDQSGGDQARVIVNLIHTEIS